MRISRPQKRGAGLTAATVSARAVGRLIDVGVAAGIRRDILMAAARVTEEDLCDSDARVPLASEIAIWQTLARHTADPEFGIRSGQAFSLRRMGLVGYVARFSSTLRGALHRVQRYGRLFTEAVEFRLEEGRREVALATAHPALGPGRAVAEGYRLAAVLQASRELTGVAIVPAAATFTYPRPAGTEAHSRHFSCPLQFGAHRATVIFRKADLDLPVVEADETLAGYLSQYAEQVLASLVRGETMRHQARAAIWSLLGDGPPSLGQVAALLRLPPRTLQRRLAAEGTSVRGQIEEIRKTMALAVLRERSVSIEDVAFLLGYAEPSAFFRAFRRWTGSTPRRVRRRDA
jgi:AraC-like DNA-binding protein